jgi:hypothetical protein
MLLVGVPSEGNFGRKKWDAPLADFLMPATSGLSTNRPRTSDLGLARKPEHLGRDFLLLGHHDRPGIFPIFREDSQFHLYLQGFRYTNDREKLAEGRLLASYCATSALGVIGRRA